VLNQIYYSVRNRLHLRLIALAVVVLGNMFFLFLASRNDFMEWQAILGVVFASFAFLGIFIANIIASDSTFKKAFFKEPGSYLMTLTPVPTWKRILGTLIPSVIFDILAFSIGIIFIVVLAVGLNDGTSMGDFVWQEGQWRPDRNVLFVIGFIVVGYAWLILTTVFWHSLTKTVLSRVPFRKLVGAILTIAVVSALSWLSVVLFPFGEINRFGPFFTIFIHQMETWHLVVMLVSLLVQAAILLFTAAQLLDRRV